MKSQRDSNRAPIRRFAAVLLGVAIVGTIAVAFAGRPVPATAVASIGTVVATSLRQVLMRGASPAKGFLVIAVEPGCGFCHDLLAAIDTMLSERSLVGVEPIVVFARPPASDTSLVPVGMRHYFSAGSELLSDLNIRYFPTIVFVDPQGIIRGATVGAVGKDSLLSFVKASLARPR